MIYLDHYAENYSLLMGLLDFLPVILFLLAGIIMIKDYSKYLKGIYNVFLSSGVMMIFLAGALKAMWKVIISLNICDFEPLNKMFLPLQAFGFVF